MVSPARHLPLSLLSCCLSQHSSQRDPAKTLREITSLPGSKPSIGLPSHAEEQSPTEVRRAGDRQAVHACTLRSLCLGSTGPRPLTLQAHGCSRASALAAPSSWSPHPTAAGLAPSDLYLNVTCMATCLPWPLWPHPPPSNPCAIPFCLSPEHFLSLLRDHDNLCCRCLSLTAM